MEYPGAVVYPFGFVQIGGGEVNAFEKGAFGVGGVEQQEIPLVIAQNIGEGKLQPSQSADYRVICHGGLSDIKGQAGLILGRTLGGLPA